MINYSQSSRPRHLRGFSLVEMLVVIGIIAILVGVGASLIGSNGGKALKTAGDQLMSVIEQGRTSAITRRKPVVLALLEPGQGNFDDGRCRLGLLELDELPKDGVFEGRLLQRWQVLPGGVAFFGGAVDSLNNVRDEAELTLQWKNGTETAEVHALVFSPRGGLSLPQGSESVVISIGTGTYKAGQPVRTSKSGGRTIRVGRVVARPWNLDL